MPTITLQNHRRTAQYLCRSHTKLLHIFLKCIIMVSVFSIFFFLLGFAAIVLLNFHFLSHAFGYNRLQNVAVSDFETLTNCLPSVTYSSADFSRELDCAICLDSFVEGDLCWNLPICKHLFHARCVDRWIGKKPNCPVCRTRVDFDSTGSVESRIGDDDRWKWHWTVGFEEGTSH